MSHTLLLDKYNFVKLTMDELPSRGKSYPEGSYIKGRFLNLRDVKFIGLINKNNATTIVNEIIERCFYFHGIKFEDLLLEDRKYLSLWLRANSFINNSGYKLEIKKCSGCSRSFSKEIRLENLKINYLDGDIEEEVTLPDSGETFIVSYPKIDKLGVRYEDSEIEEVIRSVCVDSPLEFVLGLSAYDYVYLLEIIKERNIGLDFYLNLECPHCGESQIVKMVIDDDSLFGQINIRDIISLILNISKYTSYRISEDTSWGEIEIMQDVVNQMIKTEEEEMQKQELKAKSKMSSMRLK